CCRSRVLGTALVRVPTAAGVRVPGGADDGRVIGRGADGAPGALYAHRRCPCGAPAPRGAGLQDDLRKPVQAAPIRKPTTSRQEGRTTRQRLSGFPRYSSASFAMGGVAHALVFAAVLGATAAELPPDEILDELQETAFVGSGKATVELIPIAARG